MNKDKTAFLFPGAGVKPYGNEQEIIEKHPSWFLQLFKRAEEITGLKKISPSPVFDTKAAPSLNQLKSQVFTYCFGTGVFNLLINNGFSPDITMGYSMGIYTAIH